MREIEHDKSNTQVTCKKTQSCHRGNVTNSSHKLITC